jgi:RimJ/RimL family protein N-acetyltransferase
MQKLAGQLGMREEGRRRGAMWKRGRFVDVLEYGVLADEFRATVKERP